MEKGFDMKKAFLNWRYYLMVVIGFVVVVGVFGIPEDTLPIGEWTWKLILSKVIGFSAGYLLYKLVNHWESKNLVPELSEILNEE